MTKNVVYTEVFDRFAVLPAHLLEDEARNLEREPRPDDVVDNRQLLDDLEIDRLEDVATANLQIEDSEVDRGYEDFYGGEQPDTQPNSPQPDSPTTSQEEYLSQLMRGVSFDLP